jgi:vacuolar protein sorting-associated protein 35
METATSIELFVEILDRYVYYFDQQNESVSLDFSLSSLPSTFGSNMSSLPGKRSPLTPTQVTTKYLNGLIELIHSNLATNQQDSGSIESSKKHFNHTLEGIKSRQLEGVVLYPK